MKLSRILPLQSIRFRLVVSQAASMALILITFNFVLAVLLEQVLNANLDRFLHQQSDNFKATISLKGNGFTFHDIQSNFNHSGEEEEEIPFFLQMIDKNGKTLLLSGNMGMRRLYHGGPLPNESRYKTVYFFEEPSRQLTSPIIVDGQNLGWVIVTLPFAYLDEFTNYKDKILLISTLAGILMMTLLSILFVKLAMQPVKELSQKANDLAKQSTIEALPSISEQDEFSEMTTTLNHLLARAGASMETLELFAANASHELKTPLALMRSELSMLSKKEDVDINQSVGLLSEEVDRMQTMIDNLLLLSHAKNPYKTTLQEVWLNDFISDEAGRLQLGFLRKKMIFDFSEVASIKIRTDIYLLQLILDNILRNAIFHTPEATTITISSSICENCVCVSIEDMGPGIPQDQMSTMFDPFVRGIPTTSQVMKGSGLGLSIAKWAMDHLGGGISLENNEPTGLRVNLSIPQNDLISLEQNP